MGRVHGVEGKAAECDGHTLNLGGDIGEEALDLAILGGARFGWSSAQSIWNDVQASLGRVVSESYVAPVDRG